MKNVMKTATLESKFPLLAVENGCIISKDADITVAYRVELPELFTLTRAEYESMHSTWAKAVKVLPNYQHRGKDFFIEEGYRPDICKEDLSFLSHFRAAFQRTAVLAAHLLPFPDEDHERAQPDNQQFQRAYTGIHHSQRDAGQGNRYPFYGKLRAVRAHRERQRSDPYHPPDG